MHDWHKQDRIMVHGKAAHRPRVVVLKMQSGVMTNYNYLIVDPATRKAVIVDPAWHIERIDAALADEGAELAGILITHAHPDHLNLAGPMSDARRCPIWMSNREIGVSDFHHPLLVGIDTAPWKVGELLIEPLFTPGHTPGSLCYLIGEDLFSGDVLFAEGCGICPDIEAAHAMFASLEYLTALLTPQTRIFPGHSYGKTPGQPFSEVLKDNIYLQFSNRHAFASFRMRRQQANLNFYGS